MKVLQINTVYGTGSTGRIASDLSLLLKENGHESYVAYGRNEKLNINGVYKIGNKFDNYYHFFITRLFDLQGFGSKNATQKLIKYMNFTKPDIIHLHNIHGYYLNIEILFEYLKKINKPVVWTLHDCWSFTGHCSHFDYANCLKWLDGCYSCVQKFEYPKSLLLDNSKSNYNKKKKMFTGIKNMTIVTPSKWLANLVKKSFLNIYPVKVINNGIDTNVFKPTPSDFRKQNSLENKFVILGVASVWDKRKGLEDFIKLRNMLDEKFAIILVGLNKNQIKKLPKDIIGIQRTNSVVELAKIYSMADVFLNLSVEETMGLTTIEALACGTPVIVFDKTAVPEFVDKFCGKIIKYCDLKKMVELLKMKKINELNKDYCVKFARLYNKKDKYKEYINLYENLI